MGDAQRLVQVLLDQQHADAAPVDRLDQAEDLLHHDRHQAERGLVEDDQARLGHQAAGDRQHLLLAAAHRARQLVAPLGQPREQRKGPVDQRPDRGSRLDVRTELQVLHHRHLREHQASLGHQRDAAAYHDVAGRAGERLAREADVAALRCQHAGNHAHRGRLAGAVGAQQRHDLARPHAQRDVAHRGRPVVGEGEAGDVEQAVAHAVPSAWR